MLYFFYGEFVTASAVQWNLAVCRGSYLQEYSSGVANGVAYAWTFAGAEIIGNSTDRVIQVNWNGVGEGGKINLVHTDLLTGCRNSLEKEVIYQELPEVNLVLPEMVGYCFDSLALNQAWPSGGQYIVNGFRKRCCNLPINRLIIRLYILTQMRLPVVLQMRTEPSKSLRNPLSVWKRERI